MQAKERLPVPNKLFFVRHHSLIPSLIEPNRSICRDPFLTKTGQIKHENDTILLDIYNLVVFGDAFHHGG